MQERARQAGLAERWERLVSVETTDEEVARLGRLFNTLMVISTGIVLAIALTFFIAWVRGLLPDLVAGVAVAFPLAFVPISLLSIVYAKKGYLRRVIRLYVWTNFFGIALAILLFDGVRSPGWLLYIWTITIAGTLLAPGYALGMTGLALFYFLLLSFLGTIGLYTPPFTFGRALDFIRTATTWNMIISTVALLTFLNMRSLHAALDRLRVTTQELEEHQRTLEERVAERTAELERRSLELETASQIARDAVSIRDVQTLLDQAVRLISDRFGFYHVGIFLVDEEGEYAVLRAASSEGGQRMLARGHRLAVGKIGIVGYVAGTGEPRIALDVGEDAVFFDNPDLPRTRSEMALPLKVGQRVIGVLDVQSEQPAAFTEEDVSVLQILADQLAVAIENARLLERMQQTVRELERLYGEYAREAWRAARRGWRGLRYRQMAFEPLDEVPEETRRVLREGRSALQPIHDEGDGRVVGNLLAVPVRLRGQTIGALNIRFAVAEVPPEAVRLMEEVANRLALVLESARLLEETQRRAARDRLLAQITARIRASMDPEVILRTAVRELGMALGVDRTLVQLRREITKVSTQVDALKSEEDRPPES